MQTVHSLGAFAGDVTTMIDIEPRRSSVRMSAVVAAGRTAIGTNWPPGRIAPSPLCVSCAGIRVHRSSFSLTTPKRQSRLALSRQTIYCCNAPKAFPWTDFPS